MTTTVASPSSSISKARIEALSDGVFAIAMTLLALELKAPDLPRHVAAANLWRGLVAMGPLFFSFAFTFVLAGQFWFWHHIAWQFTREANRALGLINLVFLMFVSVLPFSTAMLGSFTLRQPVSLAVYFLNQLALSLALNLHWYYTGRCGLTTTAGENPSVVRFSTVLALHPLACVAAIAAIPVNPGWCFQIYTIAMMVTAVAAKRRAR